MLFLFDLDDVRDGPRIVQRRISVLCLRTQAIIHRADSTGDIKRDAGIDPFTVSTVLHPDFSSGVILPRLLMQPYDRAADIVKFVQPGFVAGIRG